MSRMSMHDALWVNASVPSPYLRGENLLRRVSCEEESTAGFAANYADRTEQALYPGKKLLKTDKSLLDECLIPVNAEEQHSQVDKSTLLQDKRRSIGSRLWNKKLTYAHSFMKEYFCGSVHISSTSKLLSPVGSELQEREDTDRYETQNTIRISPAMWLQKLGFTCGLHLYLCESSIQGWKYSLSLSCLVPKDAPIFKLCWDENLPAIRELLINGKASAKDADFQGFTPLHVSVVTRFYGQANFLV